MLIPTVEKELDLIYMIRRFGHSVNAFQAQSDQDRYIRMCETVSLKWGDVSNASGFSLLVPFSVSQSSWIDFSGVKNSSDKNSWFF